jgi:hypothetical protein
MIAGIKREDLIDRVNALPEELFDEVAATIDEVFAVHRGKTYRPTPGELAGINRGLRAAKEGLFATQKEVDEVIAKFKR